MAIAGERMSREGDSEGDTPGGVVLAGVPIGETGKGGVVCAEGVGLPE